MITKTRIVLYLTYYPYFSKKIILLPKSEIHKVMFTIKDSYYNKVSSNINVKITKNKVP